MTIEELITRRPEYTGTRLIIPVRRAEAVFECAEPGDAIQLDECPNGIPSGRRIIALVLERRPLTAVPPSFEE